LVRSNEGILFKVLHHGPENAHHPGQWSQLLASNPLAIVTPYATGKNPLPTQADLERLRSHAGAVYVSSKPAPKTTFQDRMVQRTVGEVANAVRTRGSRMGHVRVRMRANSTTPHVETFGAAFSA
jgi:hypothetical protein